nr:MAG: hypothetical protein [Rhabdoviridae sp.]
MGDLYKIIFLLLGYVSVAVSTSSEIDAKASEVLLLPVKKLTDLEHIMPNDVECPSSMLPHVIVSAGVRKSPIDLIIYGYYDERSNSHSGTLSYNIIASTSCESGPMNSYKTISHHHSKVSYPSSTSYKDVSISPVIYFPDEFCSWNWFSPNTVKNSKYVEVVVDSVGLVDVHSNSIYIPSIGQHCSGDPCMTSDRIYKWTPSANHNRTAHLCHPDTYKETGYISYFMNKNESIGVDIPGRGFIHKDQMCRTSVCGVPTISIPKFKMTIYFYGSLSMTDLSCNNDNLFLDDLNRENIEYSRLVEEEHLYSMMCNNIKSNNLTSMYLITNPEYFTPHMSGIFPVYIVNQKKIYRYYALWEFSRRDVMREVSRSLKNTTLLYVGEKAVYILPSGGYLTGDGIIDKRTLEPGHVDFYGDIMAEHIIQSGFYEDKDYPRQGIDVSGLSNIVVTGPGAAVYIFIIAVAILILICCIGITRRCCCIGRGNEKYREVYML